MPNYSLFDNDLLTDEEVNDTVDSEWYNEDKPKEKKCECGAEKTYGKNATHTDYCPLYKKSK